MQKQRRRRRADDSPLFMLLFPERLSANYHVVHLSPAPCLNFAALNDFRHVCVLESSARKDFSANRAAVRDNFRRFIVKK